MRIAICDDENNQINTIEEYIQKLVKESNKLLIETFNSGESLLKMYSRQSTPFEMVFLDMQMPGINGIETAINIRNKDSGVIIIFITSHSQYVYDCFDATPFRFLVKPVSFDDFAKVFNLAFFKANQKNKYLLIPIKGSNIRINYNDILYFENIKRQICVHTKDSEYLFYSKISSLNENIQSDDFIFAHKSFIVNMNHIKILMSDKIILDDGTEIPLSKKNRKQAREKHLHFIERSYSI